MKVYSELFNKTYEEYLLSYGPRLFYLDGADEELDSVGMQIIEDVTKGVFKPEAYPEEYDIFKDLPKVEAVKGGKLYTAQRLYDDIILGIITENISGWMTFSDYFFALLKRHNMTPSDLYKKVNVARQVISRLNSDPNAKVEKATAVKLALAMELSYAEAQNFLHKAGYHLSGSIIEDLTVITAFLMHEYDLDSIEKVMLQATGKSFYVQRNRKDKTE